MVAGSPRPMQHQQRQHSASCHRPLSRASRQLFRRDASHILLHYFGGRGRDAPWRRRQSDDPSVDPPAADKRGRKRERLTLVGGRHDDGLTDEEWYALLGYAIDESASSEDGEGSAMMLPPPTKMCPLHPKHDAILHDDRNSFLIHRRYRSGSAKFGALSLPMSGRAARAAFWLEEREMYRNEGHLHLPTNRARQQNGNSVFLFQCGVCDKTFVSRYYLDKHMEEHHPTEQHGNGLDLIIDSQMICPADDLCESLGGISACLETMDQISPYYGRGALTGKEYGAPADDSFLLSSIHSLISHIYPDEEESIDDDDQPAPQAQEQQRQMKIPKRPSSKEGDFTKIMGEMRHRASTRNKLIQQAVLHRQQKPDRESAKDVPRISIFLNEAMISTEQKDFEGDNMHPAVPSSSCDEKEMERSFLVCRDTMQTCFGGGFARDVKSDAHSLVNDLIAQICEPIHCHHRLHRMAGHYHRHVLYSNDQWDEHHSYELGLYGWIVVVVVAIFYGCTYALGGAGFGDDALPSHGQKKKSM